MTSREAARNRAIEEALTWEGTPFKVSAREKGFGVDCFSYIFAGLAKAFPDLDWSVIPDDFMRRTVDGGVMEVIEREFEKKGFKRVDVHRQEDFQKGDVIFIKFGARILQSALALGDGELLFCNRHTGVARVRFPDPFVRRAVVVYRW